MSDNLSSNRSQLEGFPNEIFLEIFQYVDPIDLRSFKGLNKRINNIIDIVKLNVVVQYQDEEDLDFLSTFDPSQIIYLEIRDYWTSLNLSSTTELRSLILDCTYLSREQLHQVAEIILPCLERLTIENVTYDLREPLLYGIFRDGHFPSLKKCQLKLRHIYDLELNDDGSSSNDILRSLAIDKWNWFGLESLLHLLPNLRRLETNFDASYASITQAIQPHLSINHLKITLRDPLHDLKKLLQFTPNLTRLRIRGNLESNPVINHFEETSKFLSTLVPRLRYFDCELYCYLHNDGEDELIIQQLHLLFNRVRCLIGCGRNQCYATDIDTYPADNEYEIIEQPVRFSQTYRDFDRDDYDSDRYGEDEYNDYDNGFVDYGLGYRGNYKRNYGSSPWSGNND